MRGLTQVGITGAVRHALGASVGVTVGPAGRGVAVACTGKTATLVTWADTTNTVGVPVGDGEGLPDIPALVITGDIVFVGVLRLLTTAGSVALHAARMTNNPKQDRKNRKFRLPIIFQI
jgi:hypothetical protein